MTWVVDTGPLIHFAKAGWLGVLKMLAPGHRVVIPDVVEKELRQGSYKYPILEHVLSEEWVKCRSLSSTDEMNAFSFYAQRLMGTEGRNAGECAVLALAQVNRAWVAIVDDAEAVKAAGDAPEGKVPVRRTLALLCDAVRAGHLTKEMVSEVADDLARTHYRVPFEPGGFVRWAEENGAL